MTELRRMPLKASEQQTFAASIIDAISNNEVNPLEVKLYLDSLKKAIEMVDKNPIYRSATIDEAQKYGEKTFGLHGCKITLTGKTTYDYTQCGDPVLEELNQRLELIKASIKNREGMLKIGFDAATGETFRKPTELYVEYLTVKY